MPLVDPETLFDFPWFCFIIECLEVRDALRLRAVSRRARKACSSKELSSWRQTIVLTALMKKKCPPPNRPKDYWFDAPAATDAHLQWLFADNPEVESVNFGDAPYVANETLVTIGASCPSLRQFYVRRGQDALRINFHFPLEGLTTTGVEALVRGCPLLEELCLDWCQSVRGDTICKTIQQNPVCRNLRRLHLSGVPTSDEAVNALSSCINLEYLHLGDTKATDLAPLAACTRMHELHVCRGSYVCPEGIIAACCGFGNSINILCCAGCMQVDIDAALRVLELCPRIRIWNCVRGTAVQRKSNIVAPGSSLEVCLDDPNICRGDARRRWR